MLTFERGILWHAPDTIPDLALVFDLERKVREQMVRKW